MVNRDAAVSETSPRGTGCGKSARPGLWGARVATSSSTRRHQGRLRPVFDGAMGAPRTIDGRATNSIACAVPTRSARSRARTAWARRARARLCPTLLHAALARRLSALLLGGSLPRARRLARAFGLQQRLGVVGAHRLSAKG